MNRGWWYTLWLFVSLCIWSGGIALVWRRVSL
jgi:hypothetical protein